MISQYGTNSSYRGYLYLLIAQFMVGISIVGFKVLLQNTPAITILTARFGIACVLLLIFYKVLHGKLSILKHLTKTDWLFIGIQALCAGALFNSLLLFGLQYTSASVAGIITSALPAVVAIFSVLFLKERLTLSVMLCIGFAILGLLVINIYNLHFDSTHRIVGDLLIFLALFPEATYYILTKLHRHQLPILLVAFLNAGINVPIFLIFLAFQPHALYSATSIKQILLLLMVGISSASFFGFWFLGCKRVHGSAAGLTAAFMPIATLLLSYLFLNETVSLMQLLGMLLVIFSIVLNAKRSLDCQPPKSISY